jgi:hypothetical protein
MGKDRVEAAPISSKSQQTKITYGTKVKVLKSMIAMARNSDKKPYHNERVASLLEDYMRGNQLSALQYDQIISWATTVKEHLKSPESKEEYGFIVQMMKKAKEDIGVQKIYAYRGEAIPGIKRIGITYILMDISPISILLPIKIFQCFSVMMSRKCAIGCRIMRDLV